MVEMKVVCIILFMVLTACQTKSKKEPKSEEKTEYELELVEGIDLDSTNVLTDLSDFFRFYGDTTKETNSISIDTSKWFYYKINDSVEIFKYNEISGGVFYQEIYRIINGKLIYAIEQIESNHTDELNSVSWNCEYAIKDNKVVDYISLGMGKTETEWWEPESIFEQYESRVEKFEALKYSSVSHNMLSH